MFTETIAAVFIIGFLAGVAFMQLTAVRALERQTRRMTSERRRETRQALYRQQARQHLGTPYIVKDVKVVTAGLSPEGPRFSDDWSLTDGYLADNDRWSRKAQPDNVTSIGATR